MRMLADTKKDDERIKANDFVLLSGGGSKRIAEAKVGNKIRLGRSGSADTGSLIGMRYGEVVRLNNQAKTFAATNEYPDLDLSEILSAAQEEKDNRNLIDDNQSQLLSNEEVAAIRNERGLSELLSTLVEKSTSYQSKTSFSQEKYLRKKKKKYGALFKVEKVYPDNMAEVHLPTVNPSDDAPEEARCLRLRSDTLALILHHGDVHDGSRVLLYDKTNGVLEAALLTRCGANGRVFQVLDKAGQPNTFPARQMQLPDVKERWKAIPRNPGFLEGVEETQENVGVVGSRGSVGVTDERRPSGVSQWIRGLEARNMLLTQRADSLIVVDDESHEVALADLLPFLSDGGHVVVYSPFLEDLTGLFLRLRNDCVNIQISETWYRHHQVLPQRTHPTVNMSTAGGYLLTAIKVQRNPNPRPRYAHCGSLTDKREVVDPAARKRERSEAEVPSAEAGSEAHKDSVTE